MEEENLNKNSTLSPQLTEQHSDNTVFYNVMPKHQTTGQIIQPQVAISSPVEDTEAPPGKTKMFFSKHKTVIILLVVIILIGLPGYLLAKKYFLKSYTPEDLLTANPSDLKNSNNQATSTAEDNSQTSIITKEWQQKYFKNEVCEQDKLAVCGETADPDMDGLSNLEEFKINTDPNNNDSDQDGLSDGDEVNVFGTDPNNKNTAGDLKYNDADYIKGGYDIKTGQLYAIEKINEIKEKLEEKGVHPPTLSTLGDALLKIYGFTIKTETENSPKDTGTQATSTDVSINQSLEAKQDRDAQRSLTIKNIGIALIKYYADNNTYPNTKDFKEMYDKVKIYLKVATNPIDPINKDVFVYAYAPNEKLDDYILSFYSEVANQIIKKRSADAQKDKSAEEANIFDDQRRSDLENLRSVLLLYSQAHIAGNSNYVFPAIDKYKTELVPTYLSVIPKDPKTKADYEYKTNETFDTFTLKAVLDNPASGTTGFLCNQEECRNY